MYTNTMNNYLANIESLRAYVKCVEPTLMKEFDTVFEGNKELLVEMVAIFSDKAEGLSEEQRRISKEIVRDMERTQGEEDAVSYITSLTPLQFKKIIDSIVLVSMQHRLLFDSTLISLIIQFELLVSNIIRDNLQKNPEILKGRNLSLEDLQKIGDVDDAKKYLLDKEVESILRGSYLSWKKYLKETLKLSVKCIDEHADTIVEIFQRRNLVVHNEGIVNSVYLKNVLIQ
ncbi:hypothetical protein QBE53_06375 [Vallitaleaceae bacterium 9-2]